MVDTSIGKYTIYCQPGKNYNFHKVFFLIQRICFRNFSEFCIVLPKGFLHGKLECPQFKLQN